MTQQPDSNTLEEAPLVTVARPEDIPQLVAFLFATYKDVKLKLAKVNFNKATIAITDLVMNEVVLVRRNKDDDKVLDGAICFKKATAWWSSEVSLQQQFFYVRPELRGSQVFNSLLDAADEYAIMENLPLMQVIVGEDALRKSNVLKRKGYTQIGVEMIKENPNG